MAGETILNLDFESGTTNAFDSIFAHDANQQIQIVTTPDPNGWGNYIASVQIRPGDVWPGNNLCMALLARTNSNESAGQSYYFAYQCYIPSGPTDFDNNAQLLWELHHGYPLYSLSATSGLAPYAILYVYNTHEICFRICTGDVFFNGSLNNGFAHQELCIPLIPAPVPRDVWIQFIVGITPFSETSGDVKVWVDTTGSGSFTFGSPVISRIGIPTLPFCSNPPVHNQPLYTQLGLYTGTKSIANTDQIFTGGSRRCLSFAAAVAAFGSAPAVGIPVNTVLPRITGSLLSGQTLSVSNGTWTNSPSSFAYQWRRDNHGNGVYANVGTNANTYALTSADVGSNIGCSVTATNGTGSATAAAAPVGPVQTPGVVDLELLYEDGTTHAFSSVEANDASAQTTVGSAPLRDGWSGKSCLIKVRPGDFYPATNTIRCLLDRSNSGETIGMTRWWGRSIYLQSTPTPLTNDMLLFRLTNSSILSGVPGSTSPHTIQYVGGDLCISVKTGDGDTVTGWPTSHTDVVLLANAPNDTWIDLKWTIFFTDQNTGYVRYWVDPTGQGAFSVAADVEFTGIPTTRWSSDLSVAPSQVVFFTQVGLDYVAAAGTNVPDTDAYYDGGTRRATTEASITAFLQATTPTPPPPPPVILQPANSLLDTFTRPDGALGPNWGFNAFNEGATIPSIVNQQMSLPARSSAWWKTPLGPNCEFFYTIENLQSEVIIVGCRLLNPGTNNASGYQIMVVPLLNAMFLIRIDNRGLVILDEVDSMTFAEGDRIWIRAAGTTISSYLDDGSEFSPVSSVTDTRYQNAGFGYVASRSLSDFDQNRM